MKYIPVILAVLLAPLFASAETVKVKGTELYTLRDNLQILSDGSVERVVDQGKDPYGNKLPDRIARTPFEFSGKTRGAMIRNLAALNAEIAKLDDTRKAIVRQHGITDETKADDPARKKADKAWAEVVGEIVTLELTKLSMDDLALDKNPLGSTVVALAPMVQELSPAITAKKEELAKK